MDIAYAPYFNQVFTDENGLICANGSIEFYSAGSSLRVPVYDPRTYANLGWKLRLNANGSAPDYALNASQTVDIHLYSEEGKLIRVFTDVKASAGSSGPVGDFIPMDGTEEDNPVRGAVEWKNEQDENSISSTGMVIQNELGGQTQLNRDGLTIQIANDTGEYSSSHLILSNTQNNVPGYPDNSRLTSNSLVITKNILDLNENRVERNIEIRPATTFYGANNITSKGNLVINNWPGFNIQVNSSNILHLQGDDIELVPIMGNVTVTNGGLTTPSLSLGTTLNHKTVSDIWTSTSTGTPSDDQLITAKAALAGESISVSGGIEGTGTDNDPLRLKLDDTGNVTLTQGVNGLKANYQFEYEDAEYWSFPFTMSTNVLDTHSSRIMYIVPVHVDWSGYIRSIKFYKSTAGSVTQPYVIVLYHVNGDSLLDTSSSLKPFAYYYKSDTSTSDLVTGWNVKSLTFRGDNDTWDDTEYFAKNGEEIYVGIWCRDNLSIPYVEGYTDKTMGCSYNNWNNLPSLNTVKQDISTSSLYSIASHIHCILSSEELI